MSSPCKNGGKKLINLLRGALKISIHRQLKNKQTRCQLAQIIEWKILVCQASIEHCKW